MRRFVTIWLASLALAGAQHAQAAASSWDNYVATYGNFGCAVTEQPHGAIDQILVSCDQEKIIEAFPTLQQLGFVNPDITQTQLNTMPTAFAGAFLLQITTSLIEPYYAAKHGDRTLWGGALLVPDRYGHEANHLAFTFRFTRALDQRIDWDHFQVSNLSKVAPEFQATPWWGAHAFGSQ